MEIEHLVVKEYAEDQQQQMLSAKNQPSVQVPTLPSNQTAKSRAGGGTQTGFTPRLRTSRAKKSIKPK